ncbi:Nuclear transport factor 2, Eukaryote [Niveomyces insectorum RCEF 264]|uniref:Nuclear transport factor 2, Eukaryote n=1 Tax=Niveomyces insectorum RCEF 264 TaxID=1081102 RepID=A0A167MG63_9HYPO|nr:Nuclear transport factor 2, Eukaryote [Niveomyces insectorum RCEF 264]
MAAATAEELEVKNSTESAQNFIDWFYTAVSDRNPLASFYVNSNSKYATAGVAADIAINGLVCAQPADFEALLARQATGSRTGAANGNAIATSASTSSSSSNPATRVRYDVDGFDVHVLNPQFRLACPAPLQQRLDAPPTGSGGASNNASQQRQLQQRAVSLLVQVTGHVQYGGGKDAPRGAFTEVFVLVPNWDVLAAGPKAPRGMRHYLIQSQTFRAL